MKLINHVLDIRRLIQQSFDNRFSRMGLRTEAPIGIDNLNEDLKFRREKLEEIMASHLQELNGQYQEARQATINECVFTLFNRIAAIKVMESKELFPEIIRRRKENAGRSFEHNAWLEHHPEERTSEREGLKHFLSDQFDILGENIPLYRKDYPYALMPTADELNEIIDRFNAVEEDEDCGADVWKGDDILGWLYENFNAVEKEALKESDEKTEYDKVTLQSQVYTPHWVVKFLVDNTLGKSYLEMYPNSSIKERYKIANAPTSQIKEAKDIKTIKILDPACGSGNFLIYAFSLMYDLYLDQMEYYGKDYNRRDIPKMIVENNLYGVDLDERAAQITQIALFIKARELGGHRSKWPSYTNVVSSHFYLDDYSQVKESFESIPDLDQSKFNLMQNIWEDLRNAYKFGSLVRVEEKLDAILKRDEEDNLFAIQEEDNLFSFKNQFMGNLRRKVNEIGEHKKDSYTLSKTNDAISFLEIISQNYDVVVANPPYTDSADFGVELKDFIDKNYKKPFKVNINLYACFIKRCCELAGKHGKVGMVNPPTFMYIKTFEDLRKFILDKVTIDLFVEWGYLGMFASFARVDSAMFILEMEASNKKSTFIKLNDLYEMKRKDVLFEAYDDFITGRQNDRVYTIQQSKLKRIKSWPFIYWISDEFREKFRGDTIEDVFKPASGAATSNNNKYLRFWWEIMLDNIPTATSNDHNWVFYAKGGPYNKWYGNLWLLLKWHNQGSEIKHDTRAILRNPDYYFKEGVTYSASGSKGASFRQLPEGCIFDVGGASIFPKGDQNVKYLLGILNSKLSFYIVNCLNPTVNTQVGDMGRIPYIPESKCPKQAKIIGLLTDQNIKIKYHLSSFSLIEPHFSKSPLGKTTNAETEALKYFVKENALLTHVLLNESVINETVFDIYNLSSDDKKMVLDKEGVPIGDLPISTEAKNAYLTWIKSNTEFPIIPEVMNHLNDLKINEAQDRITDFDSLYQSNNDWEEFCIKHSMNPVEVWYQFTNSGVLPTQRTQTLAFELITDVIRSILAKDDDGVIPLSDKLGEECLAVRIEREMMERGYNSAQFNQICQLLGSSLDKYLMEKFFQQLSDHLNLFMYLPKTPFIWHLCSGEHHALDLYISIYKWNRDTLFRVRSIYAANRETVLSDRLNSIDTSTTGGRIEAQELREQLEELKQFCQKIDDLLASGYDPKLEDGVGKNIAPLQKRGMISYDVLKSTQLKKYLNADW